MKYLNINKIIMPCKKFWSTEIKNKLADSPKSASQLQLFSDTLLFVAIVLLP